MVDWDCVDEALDVVSRRIILQISPCVVYVMGMTYLFIFHIWWFVSASAVSIFCAWVSVEYRAAQRRKRLREKTGGLCG